MGKAQNIKKLEEKESVENS